jgi:hypothetical protein
MPFLPALTDKGEIIGDKIHKEWYFADKTRLAEKTRQQTQGWRR